MEVEWYDLQVHTDIYVPTAFSRELLEKKHTVELHM